MERRHTHGELLEMARHGDQSAWGELVDTMGPIIWSVTRSFRLDHATASDVSQTVWMRVIENLDRIEDPNRLPGWIATTARREAIAVTNRAKRAVPSEFEFDLHDDNVNIEDLFLEGEQHAELMLALEQLDQSDQELLRLLALDPPLSYVEIAEIVGRPVGSVGPTRARALDRLRNALAQKVG